MNYVGRLLSNFKGFYNEINSATLTGAIDIVIVKQEDGTYLSSPWHVRFGKLGVLRSREKVVDIEINGEPVDIQMKLGEAGEAFFVQEAALTQEVPAHLATSPLPDVLELMERGLKELHNTPPGHPPDLDHMPSIINIDTAFTPTEDSLLYDENTVPPVLRMYDDVTPTNDRPNPLKMVTIVINQSEQGNDSDLANSAVHFCPVTEKGMQDTGIQTEMSGAEVETKAMRSRLLSGESCQSCTPSNSTGPPTGSDNNKLPTFVQIDSESDIKKVVTVKRRKRPKHSPSKKGNASKSASKLKSTHLDVVSTESGSSGELLEEALFEMEMSEDEVDDAMLMTMGRTVSMPLIEDKHAWTDEWASSQYAAALHPFSDGDITPLVSPLSSRPPSPKSDTELDTIKDATAQTHLTGDELSAIDSVRWRWGELPETCDTPSKTNISSTGQEEKRSGGLFQFMRKTKKIRHQPEQEGIYLDDLNLTEMDPEVAALYLYQSKQSSNHNRRVVVPDEDSESGRGASLPQSPLTVDGGHLHHNTSNMSELSLSLCGGLKEAEGMIAHDLFLQGLVTYDEFCENPNILFNTNLVLKMGDKYYNWQTAGPIIMSVLAFQRPLPEEAIDGLVKKYMPKKEAQRRRGWMWWGRSGIEPEAGKDKDLDAAPINISSAPSSPQKPKSEKKNKGKKRRPKVDGEDESSDDESDASVRSEPKPLTIITTPTAETVSVATQMSPPMTNYRDFCKTLKLSSDKISSLNLRPGMNEVSFSVTTQYQGTSRCTAYIFLWKWDDRIIISDIDGTITKSDVLGQVLPMIGKDWSQVGIANLYNKIERNGYKFLYLSARAIGQSKTTRDYLKSIRQGELSLPNGPLLLSPSSLISAFHREVIERRPEEFKIGCLRDIKALFPPAKNPFHSGFGNKINDVWAYQAVNIPISRIFTVNHRGELRHEMTCTFQSTYTKMTDTVDHLYPPMEHDPEFGQIAIGKFPAAEQFSNFTYWRQPLPDIHTDLEDVLGPK